MGVPYTALTSALESQSVRNHIIIIITNTHSPPTGAWTTHWKCVQTAGRVGRDMSQPAAYITVVEKKSFARGRLSDLSLCRYPNRDSIIIQTRRSCYST